MRSRNSVLSIVLHRISCRRVSLGKVPCAIKADPRLILIRPHFVRYAQRPEAANLHKIHAKRLLANVWNEARIPFEFVLQNSLQLFSSLLVVWGTDLDRDVRARLVRQLRGWKNEYPDDPNVQMYVVRCLHLIRPMGVAGTEIQTLNLPYLRVVFAKGVASCNFPGCAELAANTTLRACSRCKVYYVSIPGGVCDLALPFAYEVWTQCSANHQQQDWKKHKPFCITPTF